MSLPQLLDKEPSTETFCKICKQLERALREDRIADALPQARERLSSWPPLTREAPPYWINKLVWDASDKNGLFPDEMLSFVSVLSLSEVTVDPSSHKPVSSLPDGESFVARVRDALRDFFARAPELPQLEKLSISYDETNWKRREALPGGTFGTKAYEPYRYREARGWLRDEDIAALCDSQLCRHLKVLDLSDNHHLDNLPGLEKLEQLEELDLSSCKLAGVPATLASLPKLRKLDLSGDSYVRMEDLCALSGLSKLEELDLSHHLLGVVPELATLTSLRVLNLAKSGIASIDELPKNLEHLDLEGCDKPFQNAKTSLTRFKRLRTLNLQQCGPLYTSHPMGPFDSIAKLPALERLCLNLCRLERLPKKLHTLESLRELDLSHNELEEVGSLGDMPQLETLDLGLNCVKKLADLRGLTGLKKLVLLEHRLTKLDALEGLESLEHLDLTIWVENIRETRGRIKKLPAFFSKLHNLRTLILVNNGRLTNLDAVAGLPNLRHLDLRGCKAIKALPDDLQKRTGIHIKRGHGVFTG